VVSRRQEVSILQYMMYGRMINTVVDTYIPSAFFFNLVKYLVTARHLAPVVVVAVSNVVRRTC
jgi:hypothetical protein